MARMCNSKSQKSNLFRNPNEKEKPSAKCKFKIEYPSVISSEGYGAMIPEKNCNQNSTSKGKVRYQCHYEERMERAERRRKKIIQKLKKNYEIDVEGLNENVTREIIMKAEILEKERKQREKRKVERMVTMMCRLIEEQRYKNRGNKVYPPPWRKSLKKLRGSKCLEQVLEAGGPCMGNVVDERKKCVDFFRGELQTESADKQNASLKSSEVQIPQNPEFASEEEEAEVLPRCKDIKKKEEKDSKVTLETVIRKPRFSCVAVEYCLESIPRRVVFHDYKKNKVFLEQLKIMNVGWETIHCRYLGIIVHSKLEGRFPIGVAVRDNVKLRPGLCCSTKIRLCSKDDTEELQASIVYETRRQKNPLQHSWFFVPVICVPARAIVNVNPLKIIFPSLTWCEATGPEGFKLLKKTIKIENSGKKACSCKISKTSIEKVDFSEYEGEGGEAEIEFYKSKSKVNQCMSFQYNGEFDGEGYYSLDYFEETAKSIVLELLENVFATFRFSKLYYIEIPPLSTVKIQVRFIPQYKGFHHEMYYVQFEDCDNCNEVSFTHNLKLNNIWMIHLPNRLTPFFE